MKGKYTNRCMECPMSEKCKQKEYMRPDTEAVQGYVGSADLWCNEHKPKDAENMGYYPEMDSPAHCAECGRPLQCTLTDYGVEYVKEALQNDGCCCELWATLFAAHLEVKENDSSI